MARLSPDDPQLARPDYPHGTVGGYHRGCSCDRCRAANRDRKRANTARTRAGLPAPDRPTDPTETALHVHRLLVEVPAANRAAILRAARIGNKTLDHVLAGRPVRRSSLERILAVTPQTLTAQLKWVDPVPVFDHVTRLLAAEGGSVHAIAAATGLDPAVIRACAQRRPGFLRASNAAIIMGTDAKRVRRCAAHVPARRAVQRVRSLMANGWRLADLRVHVGYAHTASGLPFLARPHGTISQDLDRRIEAMYARIEDRPGPSARTAKTMRRRGWYPPIYYDDDGYLLTSSIRNYERARLSRAAERRQAGARQRLRVAGFAAGGLSNLAVAELVGCTVHRVEDTRAELALRGAQHGADYRLEPGQQHRLDLIAAAVAGIAVREGTDVLDAAGIDYEARWESLAAAAGPRLRRAA